MYAPPSDGCDLELVFVPECGPKRAKNRIHLDLASNTAEGQAARVSRALALGARQVDIGQGTVPWVVLEDPGGNEFCVLEPRPGYTTTESLAAIVVDAADPLALASQWVSLTGWRIGAREEIVVGLRAPTGRGPWLEFLRVLQRPEGPSRIQPVLAGGSDAVRDQDREGNHYIVCGAPDLP